MKLPKMNEEERAAFLRIIRKLKIQNDADEIICALTKRILGGRWKFHVALDGFDHFTGWDVYDGERYITFVDKGEAVKKLDDEVFNEGGKIQGVEKVQRKAAVVQKLRDSQKKAN